MNANVIRPVNPTANLFQMTADDAHGQMMPAPAIPPAGLAGMNGFGIDQFRGADGGGLVPGAMARGAATSNPFGGRKPT
jgi:hypothetical protein